MRPTLVSHAEAALDQAKKQGRAQTVFWSPALTSAGAVNLAGRLRAAIQDGSITVHYQPVICMITGRVRGVEALARWTDVEHGPVAPDVFIGVAERSGLIRDLGVVVLRTALSDVQRWDQRLVPRVSVNVSARQIEASGFTQLVRQTLADTSTAADRLTLEITESALGRGRTDAVRALQFLRSGGVRIAVDDFGTGFSSLARLKNLPLDAMKVDREFIQDLPDPEAERLLRGIIQIATALQLDVIVEGVETVEQERSAKAAGAQGAQGWLYAKAMPAAELKAWLARRSTGPDEV